jgi:tetratricopeptide (TPR) repeat protein
MRRFWFDTTGRNAKDIARYINHHLRFGLLRPRTYGRGLLVDQAQSAFAEHIAQTGTAPNVFLFSGLPGIGRTTFARLLLTQLFPQSPNLTGGPIIDLTEGEDIANIYRSLREQLQDDFNIEGFAQSRDHFDALPFSRKIDEILDCLQYFAGLGEAVFIRTTRNLFDDLGAIKPWLAELLARLAERPTVRVVFLSTRQPSRADTSAHPNFFSLHVPPLTDEGTSNLIRQELLIQGIHDFSPTPELLITVGGHPVIARNFVAQVVHQGTYVPNRSPTELYSISESILSRSLDYENLTPEQRDSLCLLSWCPTLQGQLIESTIVQYRDVNGDAVVEALYDLILACLVDVVLDAYTISRPVRLIFRRKHGFGDDALLSLFSEALTAYWAQAEQEGAIRGNLIDTMIFMYALEGKSLPQQFRRLLLPGTLLAILRDLYREAVAAGSGEELDGVIAFSAFAHGMDMEEATKESILGLKVRALARRRRFAEAQEVLQLFDRIGYRSVYSLRGFFHRMKGELSEAVMWYERALEARVHDVAILHELCICLYRLGNIKEIKARLQAAGDRVLDNVYLLDLRIQIATAEGNFTEAFDLIKILRRHEGDRERSSRREAVLLMRRDQNFAGAVELLDRSIARQSGLAMEHRSSRAMANAYLGRFSESKRDIETIRKSKHGRAEEIALRLDAHLSLAAGDWSGALDCVQKFQNMIGADYILQAKAFEQKANDVRVPIEERHEARERTIVLRSQHRSSSEYDIA